MKVQVFQGLKSTCAFAALVLIVSLFLQPVLSAQSQFATLSGSVTDASGGVISGANVTIRSSHSADTRKTVTNGEGFFSVPALPAGTYDVFVEMKGFQKWHATDLILNGSDSRTMKIELKLGSASETVLVEARVTELATTDSGEKSALISSNDLQHLSLVGRNAIEYLKILPGATLANNNALNSPGDSGQVVQMAQSPLSLAGQLGNANINGQTADVTQDGQRIADTGKGTFTPVNQNPEMISELKVLSSNFSAENAKGPVVVNSETKGGTSEFHGAAYLLARNSALNATDHHNIALQVANPKTPSSYYYPGANIGGPLIIPGTGFNKSHKKLFFFDGFEYYKQTLDAGVARAWVPTPTMLNGDFSSLSSYTGPTNADLYTVPTAPPIGSFPGYDIRRGAGCTIAAGVLSSACISPAAQIFMKDTIPLANANPATNSGYDYVQTFSTTDNSWQNVTREDWNISDNTKVYVTWSHQQELQQWPAGLWVTLGDNMVPTPSPIDGKNKSDVFNGTFVHVFSPTMTVEVRAGFMKSNLLNSPANLNKFTKSGTGYPLTGIMKGDTSIPSVSSWSATVPNLGDVGYDYHPNVIDNQGIPSTSANLTKVLRTHTLKAGFYYEHAYNDQDNWQQYQGTYQYADWGPQATGNEWSDMLMGIGMQSYYQQGPTNVVNVAQNIASFYGQDDWKITRRLTVNYGLRFEHYPKPYNSQFGMAVFIPANYDAGAAANVNTGVAWHAIDSSVSSSGSTVPIFFYSPRVGAAYDVFGTGKTVIRGGWGKYRAFDPFQSRNYTDPAGTALGIVAWGNCGFNSSYCPTWESLDNYAFTPVLGKSVLQNTGFTVDDPNNHETPLVEAYSFTIDQQLPNKFKAEISYVGNRGKFIDTEANADSVPLGTLNTSTPPPCPTGFHVTDPQCQQLYRPFALYQGITEVRPVFKSRFDSLQASLIRYSGWLTLQANYTFSKNMGDNNLSEGALSDWGTSALYGYSTLNRRNTFSAAYVFTLPNTKSSSAFVRGALNNWEISGITQVSSGPQLNAQSANFNWSGGNPVTLAGTPDLTLAPVITCNPRSNLGHDQFLNPNCFTAPGNGQIGTLGMPYIPGPMFWNSDLTLLKDFKIGERQKLQFRFAAFNFLNAALLSFNGSYTTHDQNLSANFNDLGQMITGTNCPGTSGGVRCTQPSTFGTADTRFGQRIFELGLKYTF